MIFEKLKFRVCRHFQVAIFIIIIIIINSHCLSLSTTIIIINTKSFGVVVVIFQSINLSFLVPNIFPLLKKQRKLYKHHLIIHPIK